MEAGLVEAGLEEAGLVEAGLVEAPNMYEMLDIPNIGLSSIQSPLDKETNYPPNSSE